MGMESDKTLPKENRETMEECNDHLVSSRNGSSRRKVAEKKSVSNKVRDRQSHSETDLWWLNLPYVLVSNIIFVKLYAFVAALWSVILEIKVVPMACLAIVPSYFRPTILDKLFKR